MSEEPGFAGQKFIPDVLPKLEKIKWIVITSENADEVFAKHDENYMPPELSK